MAHHNFFFCSNQFLQKKKLRPLLVQRTQNGIQKSYTTAFLTNSSYDSGNTPSYIGCALFVSYMMNLPISTVANRVCAQSLVYWTPTQIFFRFEVTSFQCQIAVPLNAFCAVVTMKKSTRVPPPAFLYFQSVSHCNQASFLFIQY